MALTCSPAPFDETRTRSDGQNPPPGGHFRVWVNSAHCTLRPNGEQERGELEGGFSASYFPRKNSVEWGMLLVGRRSRWGDCRVVAVVSFVC